MFINVLTIANDNNVTFKRVEKRSKNLILSGFIHKSQENNSTILDDHQSLDIIDIGKQPQENDLYETITTTAITGIKSKLNDIYVT